MSSIRLCLAATAASAIVLLLPGCAGGKARPTAAAADDEVIIVRRDDPLAYRFDMQQNGRRMSADEFDAWMKARGIPIATAIYLEPDLFDAGAEAMEFAVRRLRAAFAASPRRDSAV